MPGLCVPRMSLLVQTSRDVFSACVPICRVVEPPGKEGLATHTLVFIYTPVFPLAREFGGRGSFLGRLSCSTWPPALLLHLGLMRAL